VPCHRLAETAVAFFVASSAGIAYADDPPTEQVEITKTADLENAVDVTIKLEELDRHQLEYGGGMSSTDGVFDNVSYTNTNVLGRGEILRFFGQYGARSSAYQLSFTEPYLFGRMTAGIDLFTNQTNYLTPANVVGYSEARRGINMTVSHALPRQSRVSLAYAYEAIDTALFEAGRHLESRISPAFVHDTVDDPSAPRRGRRITARASIAGGILGVTANYVRPEFEAVQYVPHTSRTALGLRIGAGWLSSFGATPTPPYYARYFLGGENQIRGVDVRTIGPTDSENHILGGDKFVLFNAEYYFDIHRRVRLVLFHDAGQAYANSQTMDVRDLRSSSGIELRVVLPKVNVPLRLIYGWNTDRDASQPARAFKVAVGWAF
jgi:outer membrane protein insertion porin family